MIKKVLKAFPTITSISIFSFLSGQASFDNPDLINYTKIGNIVLSGMIIVFASLFVILLFVSLLQYVERKEKITGSKKGKGDTSKKPLQITSITPIKKQEKMKPVDHHVKVAAITIIFLYETEIEKRSQMLLTMKRAKISAWQESTRLLMPNYAYNKNIQRK